MTVEIGELIIEVRVEPDKTASSASQRHIEDARLVEHIANRVLERLRDEQERWT